jgi:hypothetical protein
MRTSSTKTRGKHLATHDASGDLDHDLAPKLRTLRTPALVIVGESRLYRDTWDMAGYGRQNTAGSPPLFHSRC